MNEVIPVCEPLLAGKEKQYVLDALETGWISSSGKYLPLFEGRFADFCGVKHGVAACNGTAALHLALLALGIKAGDEVIIPDFTMIASAFAVCYTGALPVFVDAEPDTWNIDPVKIEEKITARTKAIMVVHIYGHPCDMEKILALADKHGLSVIEDAAEVHGADYLGKKCGSLGHIAAFSFFANKIATTGEGGMVVTNDDGLADKCRYYRNLCFPLSGTREYRHEHIGFNYRMPNTIAAIGLAQVENIHQYIEARRRVHAWYLRYLKEVPGIKFQPERDGVRNVYWMNGIVIEPEIFGVTRDGLMAGLRDKGVETRLFFRGMHTQGSLREFGCDCSGSYPVSEWLGDNGLYLPSGSGLRKEQVEHVCRQLIAVHDQAS